MSSKELLQDWRRRNCYKIDEEGIVTRLTHLVWTQTCGCKVHNI